MMLKEEIISEIENFQNYLREYNKTFKSPIRTSEKQVDKDNFQNKILELNKNFKIYYEEHSKFGTKFSEILSSYIKYLQNELDKIDRKEQNKVSNNNETNNLYLTLILAVGTIGALVYSLFLLMKEIATNSNLILQGLAVLMTVFIFIFFLITMEVINKVELFINNDNKFEKRINLILKIGFGIFILLVILSLTGFKYDPENYDFYRGEKININNLDTFTKLYNKNELLLDQNNNLSIQLNQLNKEYIQLNQSYNQLINCLETKNNVSLCVK